MEELVLKLIENNLTISSIESFTVGMFGAAIGSIGGASKTYKGTLVTYQTIIKTDVLDVSKETVEKYGVVSKEVAEEMCNKGKDFFSSDICVSFTGNAGPEAMEGKAVGLVYMGINYLNEITTYEYQLVGTRAMIQKQAVQIISEKLINMLG